MNVDEGGPQSPSIMICVWDTANLTHRVTFCVSEMLKPLTRGKRGLTRRAGATVSSFFSKLPLKMN